MSEMDEVKEFMSRFSRNIETKHGVEKDETLGDQVKITLLATGFGIQDIHLKEMDERLANRTEEELEKIAEAEERKRSRRERYYGKDINSNTPRVQRRHIYLFNMEEMDNDDIIAMVESSPTYQRDKATLAKIKNKAALEEETAIEEATDDSGIIKF